MSIYFNSTYLGVGGCAEAESSLGRMSKYLSEPETLTSDVGGGSFVLPLPEEEREQKLNTVDNGIKTNVLVSRSGNSISPSIVEIAVTHGSDEMNNFVMKLIESSIKWADIPYHERPLHNLCYWNDGSHALSAIEGAGSTPENPILYVVSFDSRENGQPDQKMIWYKVNINQVNPHSATREEMFALVTHEYRDSGERALTTATYNWGLIDEHGAGLGILTGDGGARMDFLKALASYCDIIEKMGRTDMQELFDTMMEMIDRLGKYKYAGKQTEPAQATIYHKLAAEKAKTEVPPY
ncbi:MAG: hypothetical protein FWG71_07595 [Synergistaceae bacterium]|nr:hypothetical protein [Synergistaceae bacterium]